METLSALIVVAIIVVSSAFVVVNIKDLVGTANDYNQFTLGRSSFESLNSQMREMLLEADGSTRNVQFNAGSGAFSSHNNTIQYSFPKNFGIFSNFTENNITTSYGLQGATLVSIYNDIINLTGNVTGTGNFYVLLKKNSGNIQIEIA